MDAVKRICTSLPILAIMLLAVFFTTAQAQQTYYYWYGQTYSNSGNDNWSTADNWSTQKAAYTPLPGGTYSPSSTAPSSTDDVVFPVGGVVVQMNQAVCASLTVEADVHVTFRPVSSSTRVPGLSVSGATTLGAGSEIDIQDASPASSTAAVSLQLEGAVELLGGSSGNPTQIHSSSSTHKKVRLREFASLKMGDLQYTYFGAGVHTHLFRKSGMFGSDVRFNDDIYCEVQDNLDLFERDASGNVINAFNIWLDRNADALESTTSSNNQNGYFFNSSMDHLAGGMLIKNIAHWRNAGNTAYDGAVGYFEFPVGSPYGNQTREFYIAIDVNYAAYDQSWQVPSATKPFRGIGVRILGIAHPHNYATSPVERYWIVQPIGLEQSNSSNDICIQVQFFPSEFSNTSQVYAARYSDNYIDVHSSSVGAWYSDGALLGATNTRGRTYATMCPTTGFGDVTVATTNNPTPVELTSFSARRIDGGIRLHWQTATELNNFGFAIERSADGERWEEVGFVAGHGTSFSPKRYEHVDQPGDALLRAPQLAYRLRQIDRDGTTEYSGIVFVRSGQLPSGVELHAAYPNPFNPATTVSFTLGTAEVVTLKVHNALGQVVATLLQDSGMEAGLHAVPFNGGRLPSGLYFAVLQAGGTLHRRSIILNK